MPCPRAVTDWSISRSPGSPPAWSPRPSRRVEQAAHKVNHQRQEGEMDAAQPSPGAELGLPVIAHSPGRKQQAVACVTQPGEGPARPPAGPPGDGGRQAGGKGPAAEAGPPERPEVLLSTRPSACHAQAWESGHVWMAHTLAYGGWILCDLG